MGPENFSGDTNALGLRATVMGNAGSGVATCERELTLESLAK